MDGLLCRCITKVTIDKLLTDSKSESGIDNLIDSVLVLAITSEKMPHMDDAARKQAGFKQVWALSWRKETRKRSCVDTRCPMFGASRDDLEN
jgi:hypothetical protein